MVIDTTILLVSVGIYVVIYWRGKFLMYYRKTGEIKVKVDFNALKF